MNFASILILAIIVICVIIAIIYTVKSKGKGCSSCSGGCRSCPYGRTKK